MCLLTVDRRAKLAEKDIVCYKTMYAMGPMQSVDMREYPDYNPLYAMSPYLSEIYKWGEEYTEAAMQKESSLAQSQYPVQVSTGFHSYRRLKDAEIACHSSMIIVKCIIPKGSYYWTGNDYRVNNCRDKGYAQYCSNRIRIAAWKRKARGAKWIDAEDAKRLKSYFQPGVNPE